MLSTTARLTDGLGSVAQAASNMHAIPTRAGLMAIGVMGVPRRPNRAQNGAKRLLHVYGWTGFTMFSIGKRSP